MSASVPHATGFFLTSQGPPRLEAISRHRTCVTSSRLVAHKYEADKRETADGYNTLLSFYGFNFHYWRCVRKNTAAVMQHTSY